MAGKKILNGYRAFLILLIAVFFISGCETFKGAYEGFKRDWDYLIKSDQWMQGSLW
jgi:hypothetical protein